MIRYAVLLLNMLGLFFYQLFLTDGVTVQQSVPSDLKPGSEYTIELTINKGATGGFAKLQQELPEGCTATAMESKGASFSFSGNAVKFIWTSLPSENEFKITYKVTVGANAPAGEKTIAGKFFYVADNAKQSVDIPEKKMNIGAGESATATNTTTEQNTATTTNTENTANTTTQQTATQNNNNTTTNQQNTTTENNNTTATQNNATTNTNNTTTQNSNTTNTENNATNQTSANNTSTANSGSGELSCTRKITANGPKDYTVELTLNRGKITGFGKLQENIPAGFTASAMQSSGASFSFSDQKVKLVWVSLPAESEIKIAYKLSGSGTNANIDGLLSYIENDETKKYVIQPTAITGGEAANTTATTNTTTNNTSTTANNNTTTNTTNTTNTNQNTSENTNTTSNNSNTTAQNNNTNTTNLTTTTVPPVQTNVNYKVQVCALRQTPVDVSYFNSHYGLSKVSTEMHEGWTKYIVGAFNEYKQARDYREDVRGKGVVAPFVTAYNSGKRITVQEALMISGQKWYK